jgi:hypothetical protein
VPVDDSLPSSSASNESVEGLCGEGRLVCVKVVELWFAVVFSELRVSEYSLCGAIAFAFVGFVDTRDPKSCPQELDEVAVADSVPAAGEKFE